MSKKEERTFTDRSNKKELTLTEMFKKDELTSTDGSEKEKLTSTEGSKKDKLTSTDRSKQKEENPSLVNHRKRLEDEVEPERLLRLRLTMVEEDASIEEPDFEFDCWRVTWKVYFCINIQVGIRSTLKFPVSLISWNS